MIKGPLGLHTCICSSAGDRGVSTLASSDTTLCLRVISVKATQKKALFGSRNCNLEIQTQVKLSVQGGKGK